MNKTCANCGAVLSPDATTCLGCGAPQPAGDGPAAPSPPGDAPPAKRNRPHTMASFAPPPKRPSPGKPKAPAEGKATPAPAGTSPKTVYKAGDAARTAQNAAPPVQTGSGAPQQQAPASQPQAPASQPQAPAPQQQAPAPKQQAPAPQQQAPAQKQQAPAPKQQAPASQPQAPAPKPQTPASQPQAPAPKPQTPAPQQQAPAPKQPAAQTAPAAAAAKAPLQKAAPSQTTAEAPPQKADAPASLFSWEPTPSEPAAARPASPSAQTAAETTQTAGEAATGSAAPTDTQTPAGTAPAPQQQAPQEPQKPRKAKKKKRKKRGALAPVALVLVLALASFSLWYFLRPGFGASSVQLGQQYRNQQLMLTRPDRANPADCVYINGGFVALGYDVSAVSASFDNDIFCYAEGSTAAPYVLYWDNVQTDQRLRVSEGASVVQHQYLPYYKTLFYLEYSGQLYSYNGTEKQELTENAEAFTCASNGSWVLYRSGGQFYKQDVARTQEPVPLGSEVEGAGSPVSISDDGTICFWAETLEDGTFNLFYHDTSGSEVFTGSVQLSASGALQLALNQDGKELFTGTNEGSLLYQSGQGLGLIDDDGGALLAPGYPVPGYQNAANRVAVHHLALDKLDAFALAIPEDSSDAPLYTLKWFDGTATSELAGGVSSYTYSDETGALGYTKENTLYYCAPKQGGYAEATEIAEDPVNAWMQGDVLYYATNLEGEDAAQTVQFHASAAGGASSPLGQGLYESLQLAPSGGWAAFYTSFNPETKQGTLTLTGPGGEAQTFEEISYFTAPSSEGNLFYYTGILPAEPTDGNYSYAALYYYANGESLTLSEAAQLPHSAAEGEEGTEEDAENNSAAEGDGDAQSTPSIPTPSPPDSPNSQ